MVLVRSTKTALRGRFFVSGLADLDIARPDPTRLLRHNLIDPPASDSAAMIRVRTELLGSPTA